MSTPVFSVVSYSLTGAAEATGLSERTLDRVIAAGDLPVRFFGSKKLIKVDDLYEWVDSLPDAKKKEAS